MLPLSLAQTKLILTAQQLKFGVETSKCWEVTEMLDCTLRPRNYVISFGNVGRINFMLGSVVLIMLRQDRL